jgi:hypothetical protein
MKLQTLSKAAAFLLGACVALLGAVSIFVAASGAVHPSATFAYLSGVGFLLMAAPLVAFAFSRRLAKALLVLFLVALALAMLWLTFQPDRPVDHAAFAQVAAIAFAVMLLARVGLSWHRK